MNDDGYNDAMIGHSVRDLHNPGLFYELEWTSGRDGVLITPVISHPGGGMTAVGAAGLRLDRDGVIEMITALRQAIGT